jgi:hypothetical protein
MAAVDNDAVSMRDLDEAQWVDYGKVEYHQDRQRDFLLRLLLIWSASR